MAYWLVDRMLPGAVASLIITVPVWVSHILLKRHVSKVTADQTRTLEGQEKEGGA